MRDQAAKHPLLQDIFRYFLELGCFGFGGPVALVGYMQKDLVEREKWVTEEEFSEGVALGATLPGPLAAQVAMWIGYLRGGFWGCTAAAIGLIAPAFLIVLVVSWVYVNFEQARWVRALFYGIGPAVAALIAESCYRLANRYLSDWKMITLAVMCGLITVLLHAELAVVFLAGGLLGIVLYGRPPRSQRNVRNQSASLLLLGASPLVLLKGIASGKLWQLGVFFFKAGAFTFGSGLAVAPFIHQGAVLEYKWLTEREFVDTVAVGMITPGPVVIMATFAGYLVCGFWGALIASVCVFLPIYLMVFLAAPHLAKHRNKPKVAAFVKGATAAAVGVISGAGFIISRSVINDALTALLAILALVLIVRWKVAGPLIVAGAGIVGLMAYH